MLVLNDFNRVKESLLKLLPVVKVVNIFFGVDSPLSDKQMSEIIESLEEL